MSEWICLGTVRQKSGRWCREVAISGGSTIYRISWPTGLRSVKWIGHFRVPKNLPFKASLSAKPLIWKWFLIMMQVKLIFTTKVSHLASFESEIFWNSEMAYWNQSGLSKGLLLNKRCLKCLCYGIIFSPLGLGSWFGKVAVVVVETL